jgi:hypothetical protein
MVNPARQRVIAKNLASDMGLLRGKLDYDSKEDETYDVQDDEKKK